MEKPIKMDDFGVPLFQETSTCLEITENCMRSYLSPYLTSKDESFSVKLKHVVTQNIKTGFTTLSGTFIHGVLDLFPMKPLKKGNGLCPPCSGRAAVRWRWRPCGNCNVCSRS